MALDNLSLSIIADELSQQMLGTQFGGVMALSQYDYAFPYSLKDENGLKHGTFIFSLDPTNPFVTYSFDRYAKIQNNTIFFNSLKKLTMAKVTGVKKHPEGIQEISFQIRAHDQLADLDLPVKIIMQHLQITEV